MAHFAQINEKNIVTNVIVIDNKNCCGGVFPDSEICGQKFIQNLGLEGIWIQTSYNNNFRHKYACVGDTYSSTLDIFIAAKPFESWIFDSISHDWMPPIPYPNDNNHYYWNEQEYKWSIVGENF